jgi:hypothetical protein
MYQPKDRQILVKPLFTVILYMKKVPKIEGLLVSGHRQKII